MVAYEPPTDMNVQQALLSPKYQKPCIVEVVDAMPNGFGELEKKIGRRILLADSGMIASDAGTMYAQSKAYGAVLPNKSLPSIANAKHLNEYDRWVNLVSGKEINETKLEVYQDLNGGYFNVLKTNGHLWAYIVDSDSDRKPDYVAVKNKKHEQFTIILSNIELSPPDWVFD